MRSIETLDSLTKNQDGDRDSLIYTITGDTWCKSYFDG